MKYLPNLSVSAKDLFNELFGEHNFSEISTTGKDEKISLYFFLLEISLSYLQLKINK